MAKEITENQIYANAVISFGLASQIGMLYEEVGELQSAINKYMRGRAKVSDVVTEIADVEIMCGQMAFIFGPEAVAAEKERKLIRLQQRIDEYNQQHRQ